MKKAFIVVVLLGWSGPSHAVAQGPLDDLDPEYGQLCRDLQKEDFPGAALTLWRIHRGKVDAEKFANLEKSLRAMQVAVKKIPKLEKEVAEILIELEKRPTWDAVDRLLSELRADYRLQLLLLELRLTARVRKLEMKDSSY